LHFFLADEEQFANLQLWKNAAEGMPGEVVDAEIEANLSRVKIQAFTDLSA
jgi:hypothetical protein